MEFSETVSPDSSCLGSDVEPNLILDAIEQYGLEDWVKYFLNDTPIELGMCTFRGTVEFSEDTVTFT